MASSEAFLPLPTEEESSKVPSYQPDGPGSQSYTTSTFSVEDGTNPDSFGFSSTANRHMLFCGCCDFRRAVLAVNAVTIVLKIFMMIALAIMTNFINANIDDIEKDLDDDQVRKTVDDFVKEGGMVVIEAAADIFALISIGFHACGIYGALNFKQWGIIVAGSAYGIGLIFGILMVNIPQVIICGVLLYPHWFMYVLMKDGVMTDYNYHKIAHCCGNRQM